MSTDLGGVSLIVLIEFCSCNLQGTLPALTYSQRLKDPSSRHQSTPDANGFRSLFVTAQLFSSSTAISSIQQTSLKTFSNSYTFSQTLVFPNLYSEIPSNCSIRINIWDIKNSKEKLCVGGTTVALWDGVVLKGGLERCKIWLGDEASETTASEVGQDDEAGRLEKVSLNIFSHFGLDL